MLQHMRDWFPTSSGSAGDVVMFVWWAFAAWTAAHRADGPQQEEAGWPPR